MPNATLCCPFCCQECLPRGTTPTTTVEQAVWSQWNILDKPSVTKIASRLGLSPADVAFIVYPAEVFGRWSSSYGSTS